ncbi:hypothetical protein GCM10023217_34310 [Gordonia alkaliphila]|uniref:Uncharacterized protein n=1 Tax=Gordonia alkaliphila TaxID=1053547 RepID=A0ABP8ZK32_9ACTN
MSLFGSLPSDGDWVKATAVIPRGLSDSVAGTGISRGTRGVVVGEASGFWQQRVTVRFDDGFGALSEVNVKTSDLTVVRRGGGHEDFERRASRTGLIRLGVVLALVAPTVYFVASYWWSTGSLDGIVSEFVLAAFDTVDYLIGAMIANPVRTLVFLVVSTVLGRWAFRR